MLAYNWSGVMKANEFIKKFGWEKAKAHLARMDHENWSNLFYLELKLYVDAYDLVQDNVDLHFAKDMLNYICEKSKKQSLTQSEERFAESLDCAIQLVESCL